MNPESIILQSIFYLLKNPFHLNGFLSRKRRKILDFSSVRISAFDMDALFLKGSVYEQGDVGRVL
jgi:hypothetical protein